MKRKRIRLEKQMVFLFFLFFISCGSNPHDIDVSQIKIEPLKIERFEQDLFSLNAENIVQKLSELKKNTPALLNYM